MEIAPLVALFAGLVALVGGGSLVGLVSTKFHAVGLVIGSFVVQFAFVAWPPEWLTRASALAIFLVAQSAVAMFLVLNRRLPGMKIALAGLLINMTVIALNGAMPVSESAARSAGTEYLSDQRHVEHGLHLRNEILDDDTRLPWLSDVIPLPVIRQVLSVGDVIIGAGIAYLVYKRMKLTEVTMASSGAKTSPVL